MPDPTAATAGASSPPPGGLVAKVLRYAAGSVLATVCSEVAFLVLYGGVHSTAAVASVVGWLAGALPNYWLNRTWTWGRRGRPSLLREVLPYVAIILATVVIAVVTTSYVDGALTDSQTSSALRVGAVGGTFLGVYAVVFVLRFFLLDQLFGRLSTAQAWGSVAPVPAEENL